MSNNSSCCGPVNDRMATVKQVTQSVAQAHQMLAILYRTLADDLPAEGEAFRKAADLQDRLAKESLEITVPDNFDMEEG